jgi:hypothetical protein
MELRCVYGSWEADAREDLFTPPALISEIAEKFGTNCRGSHYPVLTERG